MAKILLCLLFLSFILGCSQKSKNEVNYAFDKTTAQGCKATVPSVSEKAIVKEIESKISKAEKKFGKNSYPIRICIVREASQIVPLFWQLWKDVRDSDSNPTPPRIPEEGYSGMCIKPGDGLWCMIFVSTIGDRASKFKELYAHERSHSFAGAYTHNDLQKQIEQFLME